MPTLWKKIKNQVGKEKEKENKVQSQNKIQKCNKAELRSICCNVPLRDL